MTLNQRFFLTLGLVISLAVIPAQAQWQLSIGTYAGQDANLLRYYNPVGDVILSPQAEIAYLGARTRFYYNHDLTRIVENDQYNYSMQQAGIDFIAGDEMDVSHYLGARFSMRQDAADYSYFDYWKAEGVYNFKYFPTGWALLNGDLGIFYKKFDEEPAWNHWESNLSLSGSVFLPTRTTIRLSAIGFLRDFSSYTIRDSVSETDELASLWQLVGIVRLAQSFGKQVGGFSEFLYRYNPSEGNPYQVEIAAFSPIDDYFGFKGYRWTNSLKWKINKQIWSKISASAYENIYLNRPVYEFDFKTGNWLTDTDGEYIMLINNRRDHGYIAGISAGLALPKIFNRAANLEIIGSFDYFHNESNDAYFVYNDRSFGLQIRYDFQW
ncbi:MAG: hypothetical protein V1681_00860 [Candidatus Neomarinimicrobiota bacterium]